jgi:hypothetical protein
LENGAEGKEEQDKRGWDIFNTVVDKLSGSFTIHEKESSVAGEVCSIIIEHPARGYAVVDEATMRRNRFSLGKMTKG